MKGASTGMKRKRSRQSNDSHEPFNNNNSSSSATSSRPTAPATRQQRLVDVPPYQYSRVSDGSGLHLDARIFRGLVFKADSGRRPVWVTPNNHIFLESWSELYPIAYEFLVAVAEPVSRPEYIHEYKLTEYSLYGASACQLQTSDIIHFLELLSKNVLPEDTKEFIRNFTERAGKVKIVLKDNRYFAESGSREVLQELLKNPVIKSAAYAGSNLQETSRGTNRSQQQASDDSGGPGSSTMSSSILQDSMEVVDMTLANSFKRIEEQALRLEQIETANEEEKQSEKKMTNGTINDDHAAKAGNTAKGSDVRRVVSFEIESSQVEHVRKAAMEMNYPMLEEYDFRRDRTTPDLPIELRPSTTLRPYQEKSLAKMFGNGRARSGVIVLPCGAGKTCVGITASCTVRKSCLALCTSTQAVDQWARQFQVFANIDPKYIYKFTATNKQQIPDPKSNQPCLLITTYNMLTFSKGRSEEAEIMMEKIENFPWGILLLDEVHVVPARVFRKVMRKVKARSTLGLTATLVREDGLIEDLNFLIGPKLYEANWLDLTRARYLAKVACQHVWCPMTAEFYREYLKADDHHLRERLYNLNPIKIRVVDFLIRYHENRGDKILVFADDLFALDVLAARLQGGSRNRLKLDGRTGSEERTRAFELFKMDTRLVNTLFVSKIADVAIDLPEASVIIQVSSHYGSRRQEAQRLGRILRPKQDMGDDGQFNAFFYSLVSLDTDEMYYSSRRQRYLIDQGYTFKVVTAESLGVPLSYDQAKVFNVNEEGIVDRDKDLALLEEILTYNASKEGSSASSIGRLRNLSSSGRTKGSGNRNNDEDVQRVRRNITNLSGGDALSSMNGPGLDMSALEKEKRRDKGKKVGKMAKLFKMRREFNR
eukprot:g1096.t1